MYEVLIKELEVEHRGRVVRGFFIEPQGMESFPLVICSHGYNGTGDGAYKLAEYFAKNGCGAVSFDFCGGSVNSKSDMATTDMTLDTQKEDLLAVIEKMSSFNRVDKSRIYLFGESQGGMVTTLAASEISEKIDAVVLLYPAFCIPDNWNERFKEDEDIPDEHEFWGMKLGRGFFENLRSIDAYKVINKLPNRVMIMHGEDDKVVPISYSERAKDLMPSAEFERFENEGHGFSEAGYDKMMRMAYSFVSKGNSAC